MPFRLRAKPEMAVLATGEAIRDKLLALPDTIRTFVVTRPDSGEFRVVSIERKASGQTEYKYNDVPEA